MSFSNCWSINVREVITVKNQRHRVNADQDRQCTCNVTVWSVRRTVVAVETRQCVLCASLSFVTVNN